VALSDTEGVREFVTPLCDDEYPASGGPGHRAFPHAYDPLTGVCRWSFTVFDRLQLIAPFVEQSPVHPGRWESATMLSQRFNRSTAIFQNALGYRPIARFFATRSSFLSKCANGECLI
jgi:hypothetical protein